MKQLYLATLLSIYFFTTSAQIDQTHRFEVPFKYTEENYILALAQDNGLVLFRESKERVPKKEVWEVKVLNIELEEVHALNIEVDFKYDIMGYECRSGHFYLLFKNANNSKSDFFLVNVDLSTGLYVESSFSNDLQMDVSHLVITDKRLVLGGYINYRPTFVVFDYVNDKLQVVPGFFALKSDILDFNYHESHDSYTVLMGQKNALNRNELAIKSFNGSGKVLVDYKYQFEENWRALNGKMIIANNEKIIVSGSYSNNNSYYSMGYFFGSLAPGKELDFKYIRFTDLEHFFDYMSSKRAQKIKNKIEASKNSKKPYEFKTQVFVNTLQDIEGKYLIASELYKPEFRTTQSPIYGGATNTNSDYRGSTGQKYVHRSSSLTNTDGASHISYYEAAFVEIDDKGNVIYDQSITLDDVETLSLEQVAYSRHSNEKGMMFYRLEDKLHYKLSMPDTVIDSTVQISTFSENDEVLDHNEQQGKVEHWYDDKYIVWGYQKISDQSGQKRNVFYVNKLKLE